MSAALNSIDEDEINPGRGLDVSLKSSPKAAQSVASPEGKRALSEDPKPRPPRTVRPPQVPRHKGLLVRPPAQVRWFSIIDDDVPRPDWDDRWWLSYSRQNHMEPVGKRDYFDRPRRSPAADPAWPESSNARRLVENWRNEGPNWGERERARLTKKPPRPEPEFIVESNNNDGICGGQRLFFSNELPLYLDPRMLHRPQKQQFN